MSGSDANSSGAYAFVAVSNGPCDALLADMGRVMDEARVLLVDQPPQAMGEHDGLVAAQCLIHAGAGHPSDLRRSLQDAPGRTYDYAVIPAENRRKQLLISDMDSTIIQQECLDELADFAGLKAEVSAITERAMRGELDFEAALTSRVAMLKGLEMTALQACYDSRISLMPGAKILVSTMKAHGARCVLVSGGFTYFTARVAQSAGFEAHRGNTLLDDGTALTGEVGRPILGREAKQTALEEECAGQGLDISQALAMGDGANDLAMIKAAGLGIAFEAKPIVAAEADAAITHTDLRAALYFQGYSAADFVTV